MSVRLELKPQNAKPAQTVAEAAAKCKDPRIEPKYDGWRMITVVDGDGQPHLFSRTGKVYTNRAPLEIIQQLGWFPPNTILDGEMVDLEGQDCIAATRVFGKSRATPTKAELDKISYVIFDVTRLYDSDMMPFDLRSRRMALEKLLEALAEKVPELRVALTAQAPAEQEYYELLVHGHGFEGVMIKDLDAHYAPGKRGHGWFKIKAVSDIDIVVTDVLMDGKGQYRGKAGRWVASQWVAGTLVERAKVNCYDDEMRDGMTADPGSFIGRVATIKHYGVLKDGLRHPTFVCWREDKPAIECHYDNG
jgi:DNA ligase 1